MACSCNITISSAVIVGTNVFVQGTYTETCPCLDPFTIDVKVTCPAGSFAGNGVLIPGTTFWSATVPTSCVCGVGPVTIVVSATCASFVPVTCTATLTLPVLCCCPQATQTFSLGSCSGSTQLVSFNAIISITGNCTFTFRRSYGDGNFGPNNTFSGPGTFNYPFEQHNYVAPGNYIANLDVLPTPYGCGTIASDSVTVSCSGCFSSVILASVCRFLELLFLVSIVTGFALTLALPCSSIFIALGFIALGVLAFIIYMALNCQQCTCGFMQKFMGEILFATGLVLLMFIVPSCAAMTPPIALATAVAFMAIGFLTLQNWYNNNKVTCPLLICDFWCALAGIVNLTSATNVAINAAVLVWISSGFVPTLGLIISATVSALIGIFVAMGPLSNSPCVNNTPTCQ